MKGILVFNQMNDLVFSKVDDDLIKYFYHLGLKERLIEESSDGNCYLDKDVIVQILLPLMTSYKVMLGQFAQKYKAIEMEDGTIFVFKKYLNFVILNISSLEEGLNSIQKEISLFLTFTKMLYGPYLYLSMKSALPNELNKKEILCQLLDEWNLLRNDSQMFLVEAIERILLNTSISALAVNLLQEVLLKARSWSGEGIFSHSFLFVDSKLLALYSSRNSEQLPKKCLLLLIVLMRALFSSKDSQYKQGLSEAMNSDTGTQDEKVYNKNENKSVLIFLPLEKNESTPFIVHFLKISDKITLVLLYELVKKSFLSKNITFLINNLDSIQNCTYDQLSVSSFEILEQTLQNVITSLKKLKVQGENYTKLLSTKWQYLKHCGIVNYLDSPKEKSLNINLELAISSTCHVLKAIFNEFIFLQSLIFESTAEYKVIFAEIKKLSSKRLKDCSSYLEVKAEQNITMSSYISEYPGLIHFIYVDRNSDCMIAPSIILADGHLKGTPSLKKKIWEMVEFGRKYISGGNSFLCTWQHDDLKYLYNVWFENSDGKIIKPMKCITPKKLQEPEILCGNFFRELTQKCFPSASYDHIYCYELFCIHLAGTSASEIIEQSKKLAAKLWEFSGTYQMLDLL